MDHHLKKKKEQMGHVSKEMKILKNKKKQNKKMLQIKTIVTQIKDAFDRFLVDWTQLQKESLRWRIYQQNS